jgi:hypothetical protein
VSGILREKKIITFISHKLRFKVIKIRLNLDTSLNKESNIRNIIKVAAKIGNIV